LDARYSYVRRFLPSLLRTITFHGTPAGRPVLDALTFLRGIEGQSAPDLAAAPRAIARGSWRRAVLDSQGQVDRHLYTFCALEVLQVQLRRRDVYVTPSDRWGDPRAHLLADQAWERARSQVCRSLGWSLDPHAEFARLAADLDAAYRRTAAHLPTNAALRIEHIAKQDRPVLTPLDRLEEPASLLALRAAVAARLPRGELPEVLLEIAALTGFASAFTHISERTARVEDLTTSICAVLLAEACNIGIEAVARADVPALRRGRLAWVQQNYIREETLTRANACLVDYQATLPLAQRWGGGEVASADGLRFVVPVRTINAGPNPKYFGVGRGVTYYNYTSDQFTGFHGIVIPGTIRDSLYILDGLLEQQTSLRPREVISDSAGYSDIVFGLFLLLGYQFSPRLADLAEKRFWRLDPTADYGPLDKVARHRLSTDLVVQHWDDVLRVAGSLSMGTVSASALLPTLQRDGRPTTLGRAIGDLGRIAKTRYLLAYMDDETYRRRVLHQLTRTEARHRLARTVFHGQRGELRQHYREGQEDQLSALGLVLNVMVLWSTRYIATVLDALAREGISVRDEDMARLSPLGFDHINVRGRYQFVVADSIRRGELRPLRVPGDPDEGWIGEGGYILP
jgi:TnpA family transposase